MAEKHTTLDALLDSIEALQFIAHQAEFRNSRQGDSEFDRGLAEGSRTLGEYARQALAASPAPPDQSARLRQYEATIDQAVDAMRYACDLLAERTHGNAARSPGHNARNQLEAALAELRAVQGVGNV